MEGVKNNEKFEGAVDPLLEQTLNNPKLKTERENKFEAVWGIEWKSKPGTGFYFQTPEGESPFENYSSKGWKIHIAFKKGTEKEVARLLYENGLYFKVEGNIGTYFDGNKESGSTIYVGSRDNVQKIAEFVEQHLAGYLEDGLVATLGDEKFRMGSGSDIELEPKITARFDVAKTKHGWHGGDGKYSEHGLPSYTGLGGLPILKKFEREANDVIDNWGNYTKAQRKLIFSKIYGESRRELVKDFGQEFVLGSKSSIQFK